MMASKRLSGFGAVIAVSAMLIAARLAWSQPPQPEPPTAVLKGDRVVLGGESSVLLNEGEVLQGAVALLGGRLFVPQGAVVEGDVVVLGGSAQIDGTVKGDVGLLGGSVKLGQTARVEGDLVRLGGVLERHPGATVAGAAVNAAPFSLSAQIREHNAPSQLRDEAGPRLRSDDPPLRWLRLILDPFLALLGIVLVTLFSVSTAALFPSNLAQATRDLQAYPLLSLGVGGLTLVAVPLLVVLLAITICLIPFAFVLVLAYALSILLGWVVTAQLIGERVLIALGRPGASVLVRAAAGAVLLGMLGNAPVLGGLISFVSVALGLGALILSRLGTQPYVPLQPLVPRVV